MTVAHQFDDAMQQHEAATLGMWTFLATEVLFFGGLFVSYAIYRYSYPGGFEFGSHQLHESFGAINTAVLLTSSLTVALCVHFAHEQKRRPAMLMLVATLVLGMAFLGIKGTEYFLEFRDHLIPAINFDVAPASGVEPRQVELFMCFYFIMTLVHATHMLIGICALSFLLWRVSRKKYIGPHESTNTIEMVALYWHFVDLVWIFLFPLLYLVK